jgi:gliding motility-associated transport system permease protein
MRNIGIISLKELKSYLSSSMAYVVTAVFLALSGAFFAAYLAGTNYTDTSIRGFLNAGQVLILLFSVLLTMRLVAEEKKLGTWELLLTVPVRDSEIILGKYFSSVAVLGGMLVLTFYYPFLLMAFGDPDVGPMITSYLGLFLLGCASLSVGVFASSLTSNQIVSAVVSGGILFGLWLLDVAGRFVPGPFGEVLTSISLYRYFPDFVRGIVDTRGVIYYVSVTAIFLYGAIQATEADRWR